MCGWMPIEIDEDYPCRCIVAGCHKLGTFATIGILGVVWDGQALCTEHFYEFSSGEDLWDDRNSLVGNEY